MAKRRRTAAKINGHIEHLSRHRPDQLSLRPVDLIVKATKHMLSRPGMIVLDENVVDSRFMKGAGAVGLHEETTVIAKCPRLEDLDIRNGCRNQVHDSLSVRGKAL
jgi:hypothetical protein